MRQSAALMGPGKGPVVTAGGPTRIKIRGLGENEFASVNGTPFPNGEHGLGECAFVEVEYRGTSRSFLAVALIGG